VDEMDQEHRHLVGIMNRLFDQNKANSSKSEILTVINELLEFVTLHFEHEEAYMEKINFPSLPNHKGVHQRLLAQLKQHKTDYETSSSNIVNEKFFDFLTLWLSAHIQHIDMQYSPGKFRQTA
jgi:hemerythrin